MRVEYYNFITGFFTIWYPKWISYYEVHSIASKRFSLSLFNDDAKLIFLVPTTILFKFRHAILRAIKTGMMLFVFNLANLKLFSISTITFLTYLILLHVMKRISLDTYCYCRTLPLLISACSNMINTPFS